MFLLIAALVLPPKCREHAELRILHCREKTMVVYWSVPGAFDYIELFPADKFPRLSIKQYEGGWLVESERTGIHYVKKIRVLHPRSKAMVRYFIGEKLE